MTPEQLKASILQYAIQGKLVEQRAEEGTGEELLEEVLLAVHIVEEEDAGHVTVGNSAYHTDK